MGPLGYLLTQSGLPDRRMKNAGARRRIYVFVGLIFWYAKKMGDIDREFDVHED